MLPNGGKTGETHLQIGMRLLDVGDTEGKNHWFMVRLTGIRMQRPENSDPGAARDLKFHKSVPLFDDAKAQDIPVEGYALLPLLTEEDRVETAYAQHIP